METLEQKVTRLEVETEVIRSDQKEMKKDLKELLALANQSKGGWKVIMMVSGVSGVAGALVAKIMPFIPFK